MLQRLAALIYSVDSYDTAIILKQFWQTEYCREGGDKEELVDANSFLPDRGAGRLHCEIL